MAIGTGSKHRIAGSCESAKNSHHDRVAGEMFEARGQRDCAKSFDVGDVFGRAGYFVYGC